MGQTAEFRKSKKSTWKTVGAAAPSNSEQAAADAILASAAAESASRAQPDDEAPEIVETNDGDDASVLKMESGAHAGLQTGAQVAAQIRKKQEDEKKRAAEANTSLEAAGGLLAQETIYRDASGRIINVAMKRAEARRAAEEEERKKKEQIDALKGDVQLAERDKRRLELRDAKYMSFARGKDDVQLNEEQKAEDRWADPAMKFLTKKKSGKSKTGKPLYKGPAPPPNRYGILPGHRWDGVDRSNGFEKEYFAARNRRSNIKDLEYAWQMDE